MRLVHCDLVALTDCTYTFVIADEKQLLKVGTHTLLSNILWRSRWTGGAPPGGGIKKYVNVFLLLFDSYAAVGLGKSNYAARRMCILSQCMELDL